MAQGNSRSAASGRKSRAVSRKRHDLRLLLCKSIAKLKMCHFLAPAGQPEMMHKNFMHHHLRIFVVRCLCMKFYLANHNAATRIPSWVIYAPSAAALRRLRSETRLRAQSRAHSSLPLRKTSCFIDSLRTTRNFRICPGKSFFPVRRNHGRPF